MAKIRHNNFIDTLVDLSAHASKQGVILLDIEDEKFSGRQIKVANKHLYYFGTTGYLGLELDHRIKQAAIEAILAYGTQFPLSKTYIAHPLYKTLKERLFQMYGYEVLVTKNSTLGHIGVIPSLIRDEDGVVLDHQVHWSVQNAIQNLKVRDIPVEMIRHSDMNMLEDKLKRLSQNCDKVWYFADGVYSMFGDVAPIDDLKELCSRYPQLHLYFDDVHGMSWSGKNGTGYVLSQYEELPSNVVVFTTLSKSFGASGSTMVTSNSEFLQRVQSFGGPLTFSAQLEPASVGAAIASADIHLSDEINTMQAELKSRIALCNELIQNSNLPLVEKNETPVFYIGTGAPAVGYNFTNKLYNQGYYANMGLFPAVPVKKTGIRLTVSLHNQPEDIKGLVKAMESTYYNSLSEEGYTMNTVRRLFNLPILTEFDDSKELISDSGLVVNTHNSISDLEQSEWDELFGNSGCFDYSGLEFLEQLFHGNEEKQHNWEFRYLIVKDTDGGIVLATFFTNALWKEDMLASESVSSNIEQTRITDPYFHTSYVLTMGCLFTEGEHLYLDGSHENKEGALSELFKYVQHLDDELKPNTIALRDFDTDNDLLSNAMDKQGFVKFMMPEANVIDLTTFDDEDSYIKSLTNRSQKHFKKDIQPFIGQLEISVRSSLSSQEIQKVYDLYTNVWKNNLAMNTFQYPVKMIELMSSNANWEFICAHDPETMELVGVMLCYKSSNGTYCPSLVGLDYQYSVEFSVYRQLLYQTVLRAKSLRNSKVDFGFSASFEKHKLGAVAIPKFAYLQAKDNYALEMFEIINSSKN
ncbi:aminotransferase class I/II-fold pyridoxal phosphate-dependent enzyme [Marinoscillum pacificum]|uniref:aminotransferase class I/II-fold pyridoxal phosphate-dependent enzyme n=1 Tax=Marinoscillum pacificum TaxID=392723 RepID=UPI0021575F29|nr:aminotransferase class I/II-fold pyridoxal phosphate-dependent enzyme [Marinoscillum pacificum]